MKLTASMEKALNEQVVKEFHSAYLYLSMAKDMKREGFPDMPLGSQNNTTKKENMH